MTQNYLTNTFLHMQSDNKFIPLFKMVFIHRIKCINENLPIFENMTHTPFPFPLLLVLYFQIWLTRKRMRKRINSTKSNETTQKIISKFNLCSDVCVFTCVSFWSFSLRVFVWYSLSRSSINFIFTFWAKNRNIDSMRKTRNLLIQFLR